MVPHLNAPASLSIGTPPGAAALPLVLLPGTLCDERLFAPLIARLTRDVTVIPLEGEDADAAAAAVLARAPRHFALAGFSLGGIVALRVALLAPERVGGLAMIAANARSRPPGMTGPAASPAAAVAAAWDRSVPPARRDDVGLRKLVDAMADAVGPDAYAAQYRIARDRGDMRDRLSQIVGPSLVLAGDRDAICPPPFQHEMADRLPDAVLVLLPGVGHFVPLEAPDAAAAHVAAWLARVDTVTPTRIVSTGAAMSKPDPSTVPADPVLQVERRDFTQLVPTDRERVQGMRGFDPIYTDIVDYIVRCTHRIWDERDVGLIYTHYTHNCVAYTTLGTMYDRETHIRDTIQRLVEFPDRRGMAQQVIWRGDDVDGFYTSHMTHGQGRHSQYGMYGRPTGRTYLTRTVADCMILENKIYKEWIVRDNMGPVIQLGLDPHEFATGIARRKLEAGEPVVEVVENRRLLGQYPPETEADVSIAHSDDEAQLLRDLHHIYNKRMFGRVQDLYAPNCQWHGPLMREYYGVAAVLQQTMRLVALLPDGYWVPQHICSIASEEGGVKYAIRWTFEGHHLGYGALGAPTGHPVFVMGVTHLHVRDGKILDEWAVYDELSMLAQIKLSGLRA